MKNTGLVSTELQTSASKFKQLETERNLKNIRSRQTACRSVQTTAISDSFIERHRTEHFNDAEVQTSGNNTNKQNENFKKVYTPRSTVSNKMERSVQTVKLRDSLFERNETNLDDAEIPMSGSRIKEQNKSSKIINVSNRLAHHSVQTTACGDSSLQFSRTDLCNDAEMQTSSKRRKKHKESPDKTVVEFCGNLSNRLECRSVQTTAPGDPSLHLSRAELFSDAEVQTSNKERKRHKESPDKNVEKPCGNLSNRSECRSVHTSTFGDFSIGRSKTGRFNNAEVQTSGNNAKKHDKSHDGNFDTSHMSNILECRSVQTTAFGDSPLERSKTRLFISTEVLTSGNKSKKLRDLDIASASCKNVFNNQSVQTTGIGESLPERSISIRDVEVQTFVDRRKTETRNSLQSNYFLDGNETADGNTANKHTSTTKFGTVDGQKQLLQKQKKSGRKNVDKSLLQETDTLENRDIESETDRISVNTIRSFIAEPHTPAKEKKLPTKLNKKPKTNDSVNSSHHNSVLENRALNDEISTSACNINKEISCSQETPRQSKKKQRVIESDASKNRLQTVHDVTDQEDGNCDVLSTESQFKVPVAPPKKSKARKGKENEEECRSPRRSKRTKKQVIIDPSCTIKLTSARMVDSFNNHSTGKSSNRRQTSRYTDVGSLKLANKTKVSSSRGESSNKKRVSKQKEKGSGDQRPALHLEQINEVEVNTVREGSSIYISNASYQSGLVSESGTQETLQRTEKTKGNKASKKKLQLALPESLSDFPQENNAEIGSTRVGSPENKKRRLLSLREDSSSPNDFTQPANTEIDFTVEDAGTNRSKRRSLHFHEDTSSPNDSPQPINAEVDFRSTSKRKRQTPPQPEVSSSNDFPQSVVESVSEQINLAQVNFKRQTDNNRQITIPADDNASSSGISLPTLPENHLEEINQVEIDVTEASCQSVTSSTSADCEVQITVGPLYNASKLNVRSGWICIKKGGQSSNPFVSKNCMYCIVDGQAELSTDKEDFILQKRDHFHIPKSIECLIKNASDYKDLNMRFIIVD